MRSRTPRSSRTMESKKRSVSSRIAAARSSSNSGNSLASGRTVTPSGRMPSHWAAKLSARPRERGSAIMRRTWARSTWSSCSLPAAASLNSSSSGIEAHRKYDRWEATS